MSRVFTIVGKDMRQMLSNRFIAVIMVLGIIFYPVIYYLMPATVDETFKLGMYVTQGRKQIEKQLAREEGLQVTWADSERQLQKLVLDKDVQAGFSLSTGPSEQRATLLVSSDTPKEVRDAGRTIGREIAYALLGYELPVEMNAEIIGKDMMGAQIPLRDRMKVLILVFVLVTEIFALANLLSDEVQRHTVEALLVTPVTVGEFLSAKAVTGVTIAFVEGMAVAGLLGVFTLRTFIPVTIFMLLASVFVTALAFLAGAVSRDFVTSIMWSMLAIIVLIVPGMSAAFPAGSYPLIQLFPVYHLVEPLSGMLNYDIAFSQYLPQVAYLIVFDAAILLAGFGVLRRRLLT
jgi:ABC-2 type transport system permease protein